MVHYDYRIFDLKSSMSFVKENAIMNIWINQDSFTRSLATIFTYLAIEFAKDRFGIFLQPDFWLVL